MSIKQFSLPDVGEGLTEAEIVTWLVKTGDTVEINQAIVEIETAKSLVELPSPFAGEVAELHAAAGETVDVGKPIISIETVDADAPDASPAPAAEALPPEKQDEDPKLLVGYGARGIGTHRRRRKVQTEATAGKQTTTPMTPAGGPPKASPPVRKLAKDLGLDLAAITPTGEGGVRTREDVLKASADSAAIDGSKSAPEAGVDLAGSGDLRIPIKGVRKHTAAAMVKSAVRRMPWVIQDDQGERLGIRSVMQLALSFDHRVMDGQQGSQLLADTAAILTEPGLSLL